MATRNLAWWVGGAVVVVLISLGIWKASMPDNDNGGQEYVSQGTDMNNSGLPENKDAPAATLAAAPSTATPAKPAAAAPKPTVKPSDAYQIAINTYEYRIQFVNCRGIIAPGVGTLSVKKNVKFMLDNRDKTTHTIAFAGQSHKIAGENFAIVSVAKPGSYNLTCDGGGSARINIED